MQQASAGWGGSSGLRAYRRGSLREASMAPWWAAVWRWPGLSGAATSKTLAEPALSAWEAERFRLVTGLTW